MIAPKTMNKIEYRYSIWKVIGDGDKYVDIKITSTIVITIIVIIVIIIVIIVIIVIIIIWKIGCDGDDYVIIKITCGLSIMGAMTRYTLITSTMIGMMIGH